MNDFLNATLCLIYNYYYKSIKIILNIIVRIITINATQVFIFDVFLRKTLTLMPLST